MFKLNKGEEMTTSLLTTFFGYLTIVIGIIYTFSSIAIMFFQDSMVSIQKRFFKLDEDYLKKVLWLYIAFFKILFIVFVVGPYLALLLMK
jgi:hypothetical protein